MKLLSVIAILLSLSSFNCGNDTQGKLTSQNTDPMNATDHTFANHLINETSPYLLQHAHNPVNWYAWGDEALDRAQKENKLLLISIGYSACHWCHVMERESFEDEEIAQIMNENFICIKVDREERPDIDQIYMNAVQLISGSGGWPLNCFALPDGSPFYGGTYFSKNQWMQVLQQVAQEYKADPQKVNEYAKKLIAGIKQSEFITLNKNEPTFSQDDLTPVLNKWSDRFDHKNGGGKGSPKFPIPNNYQFLLKYYYVTKSVPLLEYIKLTLDKMAFGGIYDQVGGGFARYATDKVWKVPHFEKMLYDNAQLVSLYTEAYQLTKEPLYKEIVYETLEFIQREMTTSNGAFYSSLDADSEGKEGEYYIWTQEEMEEELDDKFPIAKDYYHINGLDVWEQNKYILFRDGNDEQVAEKHGLKVPALHKEIKEINKLLFIAREQRERPGLDDKTLTSWNSLMLKGYIDAYQVFDEQKFLDAAITNGNFIRSTQMKEDGGLYHSYKDGKSTINGFLEDYSFTVEAFISLYQATFDETWLEEARRLMDYAIEHFYDQSTGMFFFTSDQDRTLVARKMEINDNVIPASNSSIAKGLFHLSLYFDDKNYFTISTQMLQNVKPYMAQYGQGYSNWGILLIDHTVDFYEIAISGKDLHKKRKELNGHYLPNKILVGGVNKSKLPLLSNKYVIGKTMIYVCVNKACKLPVTDTYDALRQINSKW